MRPVILTAISLAWLVSAMSACGAGKDGADGEWNSNNQNYPDASTGYECYSANDCQPGQYCNEFHRCVWPPVEPDGGVVDPPETEHEFSPPSSGARYVYVALSDADMVARIDSETLDVHTVPVGDRPDLVVTAPGQDLALVLNSGSSSVSILRTEDGVDSVITLATPPHFNRLEVSPPGLHGVAWFELTSPDSEGIGSYQDVSVISLAAHQERVQNVSVGFRPREVQFAPDGSAAWVVTEDGVSILDLGQTDLGYFARTVPLAMNPFLEGTPQEVRITPDGAYAFARWAGKSFVRAVDLDSGHMEDMPLGGPPTDIDLTPAGDRLLAVVRSLSQVALMEVPEGIGDIEAIQTIDCTPVTVGSAQLTQDGTRALLFTNATNTKAVSLLDLATGELGTAQLRKGVRWLALSPDGSAALVLHNKLPGDPSPWDDFETQLDKRYGFSLVDLESLFVKLQITDSDPGSFTFSADEQMAYLIIASQSGGQRDVAAINLANFIVGIHALGSHPTEIGSVVATNRVYVSQDHSLGRISFIDVSTGQIRTVTGFHLNSQVIE